MVILGIDPAVNKLGYGVIEEHNGFLKVLTHGRVCPSPKFAFLEKLQFLSGRIEEIIEQFKPEAIAIEEIYVANNVQVALKIGQVMGLVMGLGLKKAVPFVLIPPREVKKNIVGTGAADKEQVKYMVEQLTGVRSIKNFDESDALAVAISYLSWKRSHDLLSRG